MSGLELILLRPWWLAALPLLVALGWWLWQRQGAIGAWQKAANPALLQALARLGQVDTGAARLPVGAALTVAAVVACALAGPAVERRDTVSFRNLDGVLVLVDVSASVTEHDDWPQLQAMGRFALASLGTRPGGLIVFGGDAYVASDMTLDHMQLGQTFSLLEAGIVPDPGSRPERALTLAAEMLESGEVIAGDVVLLSDGAGLGSTSMEVAARIAEGGARLSVMALDGGPQADSLAAVGQGRAFALEEVDALAEWLGQDARQRLERQDHPLLYWRDFGRWLLVLALVPLLLLFRREPA